MRAAAVRRNPGGVANLRRGFGGNPGGAFITAISVSRDGLWPTARATIVAAWPRASVKHAGTGGPAGGKLQNPSGNQDHLLIEKSSISILNPRVPIASTTRRTRGSFRLNKF